MDPWEFSARQAGSLYKSGGSAWRAGEFIVLPRGVNAQKSKFYSWGTGASTSGGGVLGAAVPLCFSGCRAQDEGQAFGCEVAWKEGPATMLELSAPCSIKLLK